MKYIVSRKMMNKEELLDRGALYFENIRQGFSACDWTSKLLKEDEAVDYLRNLWKINGPEDSFVDFYYHGLPEDAKEKVDSLLTETRQKRLRSISPEGEVGFLPLDEELLQIAVHLTQTEMLFFTFYFTKEPCTVWGNYQGEYIEFRPKAAKRPLQAVVFDMDGLMFDTERVVQRSQNIAGAQMGYGDLGCNIYHTLGMNVVSRRTYFREKYGEEFPFDLFTETYRKECRRILREEGIPVKTGLLKLLEFLKEEGYPMAVATSSSRAHAEENLRLAGVREYFPVLICGDQVTHSKPDPEIYQKAAAALGAEPKKTLVLEDSKYGLLAALHAGMLPIMIPDLLRDLPDLEPRLEAKLEDLGKAAEYIREQFSRENCLR